MNVTPRYKKVTSFAENLAAVVGGCLLLSSGPILSALGWIRG